MRPNLLAGRGRGIGSASQCSARLSRDHIDWAFRQSAKRKRSKNIGVNVTFDIGLIENYTSLQLKPVRASLLHDSIVIIMNTFLFLGDSITQHGYRQDQGFAWVAALAHRYMNRVHVTNAGKGGYSTDMYLSVLPGLVPPPPPPPPAKPWSEPALSYLAPCMRLVTVLFGANDAKFLNTPNAPSSKHRVPLDDFCTNLKAIVQHPLIAAHGPGTRVLLVTPPPFEEIIREEVRAAQGIHWKLGCAYATAATRRPSGTWAARSVCR